MALRPESSIKRELYRVRKELAKKNISEQNRSELYGAQQALCWALQDNAMSPSKASGKAG